MFAIRCLMAALLLATVVASQEPAPKAPSKLVFQSKPGAVTFDHAAHLTREKGVCANCHPKVFAESQAAPLNFKAKLHRAAEADKTSCGACHRPGEKAFDSRGNCAKCHAKG